MCNYNSTDYLCLLLININLSGFCIAYRPAHSPNVLLIELCNNLCISRRLTKILKVKFIFISTEDFIEFTEIVSIYFRRNCSKYGKKYGF